MDVCLFARPDLAPDGSMSEYLEIARLADAAGLHSLAFGEHLVMGEDTSRYPYGPWGHQPDTAWPDPLTVLAAVAAVTAQIRLSTAVLLAPLRAGLELAKVVATLDVVSGGRVELGVGTGWQSEEYTGVGIAWAERQRRFDDVIEICRTAWGEQPFDVTVDGTELTGLTAYPRPVQARIPLLYGVQASPANVARIARLGDGWTPVGVGPDAVRAGVDALRAGFEDAGRDPADLIVRAGLPPMTDDRGRVDVDRTFAPAADFIDAGATMLIVGFNHRLSSRAEAADLIAGYAAAGAAL